MSRERRFSESEMREVFERAAAEQERAVRRSSEDGLTLTEMQEVAASAGIAPEFVDRAARSVALGEPEQGRLMRGPIARGVYRTELLPTPPTDALWDQLVVDLRRTFSAQGKTTEGGRVREWRNGNLRATLEAAGDGSRLHLRTRRDDWVQLTVTAAVLSLVALFMAFFSSTSFGSDPEALRASLMVALGSGLGAVGLWTRQRAWAGTRERQMEEVAARTVVAAHEDPPGRDPVFLDPVPAAGRIDPGLLDDDPLADDDRPPESVRRQTG